MGSVGLFFGSSGGVTESVAQKIAAALNAKGFVVDVIDIANASKATVERYDKLILGSSTWGMGDLQDDWDAFIDKLEDIDFNGRTVAFFGTGDQETYSDTFLDAMGILYEKVVDSKVNIIGNWSVEGYTFTDSKAVIDGEFIGLAIDEDNQSYLTKKRITDWTEILTVQMA